MKKVKMVATVNTPKDILSKKFENEVKNYLSMTTSYTKYYGFDDDNFKVDANDDYIEIVFHGNRVTFFDSGGVKAYYSEDVVDLVKIDIFKDIISSSGEFWMMYDWVLNFNKEA